MKNQLTVIRPEIVACKLAAAANLSQPDLAEQISKQPRLVELLWFLQHHSTQPGGLGKFALDLIKEFPARVGPAVLIQTAPDKLTSEQCLKIWGQLPQETCEKIVPKESWRIDSLHRHPDDSHRRFPAEKTKISSLVSKLTYEAFHLAAIEYAQKNLCAYLASLCNEVDRNLSRSVSEEEGEFDHAPWYFENIIPTLFAAMESHAQRESRTLAMTEVALKVFDGLEYAWSEKSLVQITGDSRFGKTEAVKTWCAMHPGRARLVLTPSSNCEADLYRAVADALGIAHDYKTSPRRLKETVEYTIRHSGLMFIFDEAHFILPTRFSETTVPFRLNWIRTQMVDHNVPVVMVSTPQAYNHAVSKFVKASGYNFAQFLGRIALPVNLPSELEESDLLAVVKIHCPELDGDLQELVVAKAMQSESYIMAVQAIGRRARYIAARDRHPGVTLEDVELAITEVIPASAQAVRVTAAPDTTRTAKTAASLSRPRNTRSVTPAPALEIPARDTGANLIPA